MHLSSVELLFCSYSLSYCLFLCEIGFLELWKGGSVWHSFSKCAENLSCLQCSIKIFKNQLTLGHFLVFHFYPDLLFPLSVWLNLFPCPAVCPQCGPLSWKEDLLGQFQEFLQLYCSSPFTPYRDPCTLVLLQMTS